MSKLSLSFERIDKVEAFVASSMKQRKMLGVHMRGTDKAFGGGPIGKYVDVTCKTHVHVRAGGILSVHPGLRWRENIT